MSMFIDCLICGVALGCYTNNDQGSYIKQDCGQQCNGHCPGPETKKVTHVKCTNCNFPAPLNRDISIVAPGRA